MILSGKSRKRYRLLPNALSVFRGVLAAGIPFLIFSPNPAYHLWALLIFIAGVFTDFLDGYFARRFKVESSSGKFIDPFFDKILILLCLWTFSQISLYSIWLIVPIVFREIFITFFRIGWIIEGNVVPAEPLGKAKFGFQVASVGFSFLLLFSREFAGMKSTESVFYFFTWFSLLTTLFLTLYSGYDLCKNNRALFFTEPFARYLGALGVGLLPWAPGTWGTLLGIAAVFLTKWNTFLFYGTFFGFLILGYWAVSRIDLKKNKDPGYVVVDEFLGVMVPFMVVPLTAATALLGFLLFRFFDITKIWPLKRLENLNGYWGILTDDLGAGVYSAIVLWALIKI